MEIVMDFLNGLILMVISLLKDVKLSDMLNQLINLKLNSSNSIKLNRLLE